MVRITDNILVAQNKDKIRSLLTQELMNRKKLREMEQNKKNQILKNKVKSTYIENKNKSKRMKAAHDLVIFIL